MILCHVVKIYRIWQKDFEMSKLSCGTALAHISHPRYKNIKAILENKQDKPEEPSAHSRTIEKTFLRGADYYKGGGQK